MALTPNELAAVVTENGDAKYWIGRQSSERSSYLRRAHFCSRLSVSQWASRPCFSLDVKSKRDRDEPGGCGLSDVALVEEDVITLNPAARFAIRFARISMMRTVLEGKT